MCWKPWSGSTNILDHSCNLCMYRAVCNGIVLRKETWKRKENKKKCGVPSNDKNRQANFNFFVVCMWSSHSLVINSILSIMKIATQPTDPSLIG